MKLLRSSENVADLSEVRTRGFRRNPRQFAANTAMGWKNANLRSEMTRLLRRAGVSGWPRLFHSMRASRQTELQREFPLHVVCSWLGNSPRIAQQSYLLVTEDDFERAAGAKKVMVEG